MTTFFFQAGRLIQKWTTPQKEKLREHFRQYYDKTKNNGRHSYPPSCELYKAVQNIPEFKEKTPEQIKSKLQNDFSNWSLIEESIEQYGSYPELEHSLPSNSMD